MTQDSAEIHRLVMLLSDQDKEVRARATYDISKSGNAAVGPLGDLLRNGNWKIRYRAAEGLGLIGDSRAVPILVPLLCDPKDHVRYMAAKSLGLIGKDVPVQPLIGRLSDENEFVRRSAATALGTCRDADSLPALIAASGKEPDIPAREAMDLAITRIRGRKEK
jgi:HEAT repeat protein